MWRWWQLAGFVRACEAKNAVTSTSPFNEVIFPKRDWEGRLPQSIRAVMCTRERNSCAAARDVHARFLAAYSLDTKRVPLVFYDESSGLSLLS